LFPRRVEGSFDVVLFHTTSAALRAEKTLLRAGLPAKLVPPRHLSTDCSIALRFEWPQRSRAEQLLAEARVEPAGIHPL